MKPLPHPLGAPLSLFPVDPKYLLFGVIAATLLALVALWMLLRPKRARRAPTRRRTKAPRRQHIDNLKSQIQVIHSWAKQEKQWRQACHTLSTLLKTHIERQTGLSIEERTIEEIEALLDESEIAHFFTKLSELQFAPGDPDERALKQRCTRATELFESNQKFKLRRGGRR